MRNEPGPKSWKRAALRWSARAILAAVLLSMASLLAQKARLALHDRKGPAATLTVERLTTIFDSNHNSHVDPCEQILLEGVRSRVEEAQARDLLIFVQVGHQLPRDWFHYHDLQGLLDYCARTGSQELHLERSFADIGEPFVCMGGCGAYLELSCDLEWRALWAYHPVRGGICRLFPGSYRLSEPSRRTAFGRFLDRSIGWTRYPSALVEAKLTGREEPQSEPPGPGRDPLQQLLDNVEARAKAVPEEERAALETVLLAVRSARTDQELAELAQAIAHGELGDFYRHRDFAPTITHRIALHPRPDTPPKVVEDALFRAGYSRARLGPAADAVELLGQLLEDFPDTRYRQSALLYAGDCYARLARQARIVDERAAATYREIALEYFDQVIDIESQGRDGPLLGTRKGVYRGKDGLCDEMLGQSAAEWARRLGEHARSATVRSGTAILQQGD